MGHRRLHAELIPFQPFERMQSPRGTENLMMTPSISRTSTPVCWTWGASSNRSGWTAGGPRPLTTFSSPRLGEAGKGTHICSDGCIVDIIEDLVELGLDATHG